MNAPPAYLKNATELPAFRIAEKDTNYFVILHDDRVPGFANVCVIEIFEQAGKTPPNSHRAAFEFFYVLHGTGRAYCDGMTVDLGPGSSLLIPPEGEHVIENTGPGKLYTLTVMTPDEEFSALIKSGIPVELDAEDIALLSGGMHS
ncbi:MAG: cupin domain-containing protein [Novosphingobium sp.]